MTNLLENVDWSGVPDRPTKKEAQAALDVIWHPFLPITFSDTISRSVLFSTLLTAVVRQELPTAPGTLINGPGGSGKSVIAKCIGILTDGNRAMVIPYVQGINKNDELRKQLFTMGRKKTKMIHIDNVTGVFSSEMLTSWLTHENWADRIIGTSEITTIPTRTLVLITGNAQLRGDLKRRVLTCNVKEMAKTSYSPVSYCKQNKAQTRTAALVLLRYGTQNNDVNVPYSSCIFDEWDHTVRKTVPHCKLTDIGEFADPCESITSS